MSHSPEFPDDQHGIQCQKGVLWRGDWLRKANGRKREFHHVGFGPAIPFEDKSNALPVGEETLRKLEGSELSGEEGTEVLRMTVTCKSCSSLVAKSR